MKLILQVIFVLALFAIVSAGATETNVLHIAMIFDDGPLPDHAEKFLKLFDREDVHVTFGSEARNVALHPATAKALIAAGHEIANHSYTHQHPKDLDDATLDHEIGGAQQVIIETTGFTPKWFWPPFLESDDRHRAAAAKAGIQVYVPHHLVVPNDHDRSVSAEELKRKGTSDIKDGTVILFHEWRDETFEQMPAIIAELRRQGCVFLTFSQLADYVGSKGWYEATERTGK
jgi:peptidoglycan/xylan/chitin deacetylase (PgdA/CDA1 family)